MLPTLLEAFAEHAAYANDRTREQEESARRYREAERLRRLDEAFNAREKRRSEFVAAIHDVLMEREKLERVLAHLKTSADPEYPSYEMASWLRRRISQLDALVSPAFSTSPRDTGRSPLRNQKPPQRRSLCVLSSSLASVLVDRQSGREGPLVDCSPMGQGKWRPSPEVNDDGSD